MNVVDSNKRLWVLLGACVMLGFLILGFFGREIYRQAPPIPERIVTADGTLLATRDDILTGQQVWQSVMIGLITGWSYERRQASVLQPVPAK